MLSDMRLPFWRVLRLMGSCQATNVLSRVEFQTYNLCCTQHMWHGVLSDRTRHVDRCL